MKKHVHLLTILLFVILQISCSKESLLFSDSTLSTPKWKTIELSFKNGEIKEKLYFEKGEWVSKSKELIRESFIDKKTKKPSYGYSYLGSEIEKMSYTKIAKQMATIERGLYGWNGTCFIWGTLVTGDNGESIFIPADISTQLLLNVCPGSGQAFAKKTDTNEK